MAKRFWRPDEFPAFEGDEVCFEAEYVRLKGWRIVRKADC
jgi:hypothetical protein